MATVPSEVTQLSKIIGALLINFGTIKDVDGFLAAGWSLSFALLTSPGSDALFVRLCLQVPLPTRTASRSFSTLSPLGPRTCVEPRQRVRSSLSHPHQRDICLWYLTLNVLPHQGSSTPGNRPSSRVTQERLALWQDRLRSLREVSTREEGSRTR